MHEVDPSKELRLLLAFFGLSRVPKCSEIEPSDVPQPYRDLLVHDGHMTVTLEDHHGSRVRVEPYSVHQQGDLYGRLLDLRSEHSGEVVMTGILLFNLSICSPEVRELIIGEQVPLGRILIEHKILRRLTSETFLRVESQDPLVSRFELPSPATAYGRLATIFYEGQPAVDLLEIVRPQPRAATAQ